MVDGDLDLGSLASPPPFSSSPSSISLFQDGVRGSVEVTTGSIKKLLAVLSQRKLALQLRLEKNPRLVTETQKMFLLQWHAMVLFIRVFWLKPFGSRAKP